MILPQAPHVFFGRSRGPPLPLPAATVRYCIIKYAAVDGAETAYVCAAWSRKLNLAFCAKSPIVGNAVVGKRDSQTCSCQTPPLHPPFRVVMMYLIPCIPYLNVLLMYV